MEGLDSASIDEVNVLEDPIKATSSTISFKPYEVRFLRVLLHRPNSSQDHL